MSHRTGNLGKWYYRQVRVCPLAYLKTTYPNFTKFSVHYLWLSRSPLTTVQCCIYLRFCGWRHLCP